MPSPTEEKLQQAIAKQVPLKELSKLYCKLVLEQNENNKVHAARILEVDRRTLQRWKLGEVSV